MPFLY